MPRPCCPDFRYEHEMRALPRPARIASQPFSDGRGLVARLRCLKALMDADRDQGVAVPVVTTRPH